MSPSSHGKHKPQHHDPAAVSLNSSSSDPKLAGGDTHAKLHHSVHLGLSSAVEAAAKGAVDSGSSERHGKGGASNYREIIPGLSVAGDSAGAAAARRRHGSHRITEHRNETHGHRHRRVMRLADLPEPSLNKGVSSEAVDWGMIDRGGRRAHHKTTKLGLGIGAGKAIDSVAGVGKGLVSGIGGIFGAVTGGGSAHHHRH
eukprot:TRINITY_DN66425_c0_g1_i1.p1 TRINITY_DN66425_c0_g1~~TRINITY_DN66425_c0_g1_i1.p1  ORF type:complete len:200 (+),score=29.18 TRINITY_DN66425_c0_g1_i1:138-737(+)